MHIHRVSQPSSRSAKSKTEVLGWASTPPEGAVLTEIMTICRLSSHGYRIFAQLQWEVPPFDPRYVNRRVSHEMTVSAYESWATRPSPREILRAVSDAVLAISTCPATGELPGQRPLPGLDHETLSRRL
jgi:hypothetical protein